MEGGGKMPPIKIFVTAYQMSPSCIGARVLDPSAFLALLVREIEETGMAQCFDGVENTSLMLRPEVCALVSAARGSGHEAGEAQYHLREGERYLLREHAFPPLGCYASLWTCERYLGLRGEDEPLPPEDATHVLYDIEVIDCTTNRGTPFNTCFVADPDPVTTHA
jgi:hypothetical protein